MKQNFTKYFSQIFDFAWFILSYMFIDNIEKYGFANITDPN